MQIRSDSFAHNARIPERCAFGIPDVEDHLRLGENMNPHLGWNDVPAGAKSLVLLCIDPDVPSTMDSFNQEGKTISKNLPRVPFVHWVMIDIPPDVDSLAEGACADGIAPGGKKEPAGPEGSRQGINDYTSFFSGDEDMGGDYLGYDGPCPPWNDERIHHYHFRLYALDIERTPIGDGFTAEEVLTAIEGHVMAEAEIIGTYTLNQELLDMD